MLALFLLPAALAAPPGWSLAPFGVGVYLHKKPVRGVVYSATQAAGIAGLVWSTAEAYDAAYAEDDDTFTKYQTLSIGAATLAVGSYLVSVMDSSRLHELEQQNASARASVLAWDASLADARR
jgi:hypothetical protein